MLMTDSDIFRAPIDVQIYYYVQRHRVRFYERVPSLFQHLGDKSTFSVRYTHGVAVFGPDCEIQKNGEERQYMKSPSFQLDETDKSFDQVQAVSPDGYIGCYNHRADGQGLPIS